MATLEAEPTGVAARELPADRWANFNAFSRSFAAVKMNYYTTLNKKRTEGVGEEERKKRGPGGDQDARVNVDALDPVGGKDFDEGATLFRALRTISSGLGPSNANVECDTFSPLDCEPC